MHTQPQLKIPPVLHQIHSLLEDALGLSQEAKDITALQMSLRAVIVFLLATVMIRVGNKRFMGKSTAVDVMLGIVFGSLISRAITGTSPFGPTLAAGLTLILLHRLVASVAFHVRGFGELVKGKHQVLVKDGEIDWKEMRRSHITEHDLHEALRSHGKEPDLKSIKTAHLERNGEISILS